MLAARGAHEALRTDRAVLAVLGVLPDLPDREAVLGRLALHLAREGATGLPGALAVLVEGTGIRSAVLRRAGDGDDLLAAAGEVVQSLSLRRRSRAPACELPVVAPNGTLLATLTVIGARPAMLAVLRSAALVLSLALADPVPTAEVPAGQVPVGPTATAAALLLADAEAERDDLADALHDGPIQELVAARWAADAAAHSGDVTHVRQAVQTALVALRRTMWQLRPRGAEGLLGALDALSTRLVETGGQPLQLQVAPDADVLSPAAAVVVYRLVQSATSTSDTPDVGPVTVDLRRVTAAGGLEVVVLTVDGGRALRDAGRWRRTAAALGGDLLAGLDRLRLTLPISRSAPPACAPAPSLEAPESTGTGLSGTAPTAKAVL